MKSQYSARDSRTKRGVRRRAFLAAVLALVLLALVFIPAGWWYHQHLLNGRRDEVMTLLTSHGDALASSMDHVKSRLAALTTLVESTASHDGFSYEFEQFAAGLVSGNRDIRAVTVAPAGDGQAVYPPAGTEDLVGLVDFQEPQLQLGLQEALESRQPTTVGPLDLGQASPSLVALQAIYQGEDLWGVVGIALDLTLLLQTSGLDPGPLNLDLAVLDSAGTVLFGEESVLAADPATYQVALPLGSWYLAAVPAGGWESSIRDAFLSAVIGAAAAALLISVLVYVVRKERGALDASVQERTAELIVSEGRWRSLTEDSPDHIIELDRELKIRFVNRASPGLTREGLRGLPLYKLVGEERQAEIRQLLERVLLSGEPARYETEYETPDHKWIYYEARAVPRTVGGEVVGVLVLSRDITERKLVEKERDAALAALQEHSALLEQRVEERTQALRDAQEQLLRQEKLAVLGQLAGSIGHELRNPLTVVSSAAHFLKMVIKEPEPDVADTLAILQRQAAKINRITDSLLGFARTEVPVLEHVDVCRVVRNTLAQMDIPPEVEVAVKCDAVVPSIKADPNHLHLVLRNLIQNGVEAMTIRREGQGGKLTVTAGPASSGNGVQLEVSDTGAGIPEEQLDRVFEPLFSTKVSGVGLGLALVRILVEGHGGTISVASQVGKGSTFVVFLPEAGSAGADSAPSP